MSFRFYQHANQRHGQTHFNFFETVLKRKISCDVHRGPAQEYKIQGDRDHFEWHLLPHHAAAALFTRDLVKSRNWGFVFGLVQDVSSFAQDVLEREPRLVCPNKTPKVFLGYSPVSKSKPKLWPVSLANEKWCPQDFVCGVNLQHLRGGIHNIVMKLLESGDKCVNLHATAGYVGKGSCSQVIGLVTRRKF